MKFKFECEEMDGMIIIDKNIIDEIKEELLYSLDICLDKQGKSELVFDFPDKNWKNVYTEALKFVHECADTGKFILILANEDTYEGDINFVNDNLESDLYIEIISGDLIMVNASEFIQCVAYKGLEMETVLDIEKVEKGIYNLFIDKSFNFKFKKCIEKPSFINNVVDINDYVI